MDFGSALCMWSLYVLPVSAWISSKYSLNTLLGCPGSTAVRAVGPYTEAIVLLQPLQVQRTDSKILLLVYKALNGLGPKYIQELLVRCEPPDPSGHQGRVYFLFPESELNTESVQLLCSSHVEQTSRNLQVC